MCRWVTLTTGQEKNERKTTPKLPPVWTMCLLHFWAGLSLYVILKWQCMKITGLQRLLLPPFGGEHLDWKWTSRLAPLSPKAKPRGSHMVGWIHPIHLDTPTMLGWTKNQVLGRSPIWGLFQPKSISTLGHKGKLSKRPLKGLQACNNFF